MLGRLAVIVCDESREGEGTERKLLGLTVGERLLRTLVKGGIDVVIFTGAGPRPSSLPDALRALTPEEVKEAGDSVVVVTSDAVFDHKFVADSAQPPEGVPIQRVDRETAARIVAEPERFLEDVCLEIAESGREFALRVTDSTTAKAAARCLMLSLHKDADGIISRHLNRKISTFISKRIAPLPIKPNHITFVVFLIGVLSGPLAFLGTHIGFALGGFCYWFSAVLDGCDGEISRLKFQGSPLGAWLDTVVDDLVCLSYIVGMYFGLDRNVSHPYWFYIGIVAVLFFLLTILPRYYIMAFRSGSGDYQQLAKAIRPDEASGLSRFLLHARDIVFRTDFLPFSGMVTAVLGVPQIFAVPFAAGAVASAVDTLHTLISYETPKTD